MEKIKKYVNELFKDAPKTKKTEELKEELLLDLTEKYNDLITEGKTKAEAYNEVISGIGDTTELINSLNKPQIIKTNENRKKTALVVAISVFIYILSIVAVIVLAETGSPDYAIVSSFLTLVAVATCLLIYHFMSLPKNNEVEIKRARKEINPLKEGIGAIIWISATIIYILISFLTSAWHITWVIFLMAVVVQEIVKLCLELGGK